MSLPPDDAIMLVQQEVEQALAADSTIIGMLARFNPGTGYDGVYQDEVPAPAAAGAHPTRAELYPAIVMAEKGTTFQYVYGDAGPTIIGYNMLLQVMAVTTGRSKWPLYPISRRLKQLLHNHRTPGGTIRSMISEGNVDNKETGADGNPYRWLGDDWRIIGQM